MIVNHEAFEEGSRHQQITKYCIYPCQSSEQEDYQVLSENIPSLLEEDVRMIQNKKEIPFWVEEKGKAWAKLAKLKVNTPQLLFALCGHHSAKSESNGKDTFEFFDNFEEGDSEWSAVDTSWGVEIKDVPDTTKYGTNPVHGLGGAGTPDEKTVGRPCVIFDDNKYKMWYSGYDSSNIFSICYAESDDGISWTKHGTAVLERTGSGWESGNVYYPYVVKVDSTYHMWYAGYDGSNIRIGYAHSTNGTSWTRGTHNPVISLGSGGAWDDVYVYSPSAMKDGTTWKIWYTGSSDGSDAKFGYATSANPDDNWSKHGSNPIMSGTQSWEDNRVHNADVKKVNSVYYMYYSGKSVDHGKIGYAQSYDGINWIKASDNPVLSIGANTEWDDTGVYAPGIYWKSSESRFWIWYCGQGTATHPKKHGLAYHAVGGTESVYSQNDSSLTHKYTYELTNYNNYIYEASVVITSGTETTRQGGLVLRFGDVSNFYVLQLRPEGTVQLWKRIDTAWTQLDTTPMTILHDTQYTLKIAFSGTSLKGYVDDILKVEAIDSALSTGKVGLHSFGATAEYDDARVRKHAAIEPLILKRRTGGKADVIKAIVSGLVA